MAITREERQEADRVVHALHDAYRIHVAADWKETPDGWHGGEWSLVELGNLEKAVEGLGRAMGGPQELAARIGDIRFVQRDLPKGIRAWTRDDNVIELNTGSTSFDVWTVVHEMAHAWDNWSGKRLSASLERYTGGRTSPLRGWVWRIGRRLDAKSEEKLPGHNRAGYYYGDVPSAGSNERFNRREDFAESVAAYVDPGEAQRRVRVKFGDDERYRDILYYADYTQTRRYAFVDGLAGGA